MNEQPDNPSVRSAPAEPSGQPGRYQRSAMGMVGALGLLFILVSSCVGLQALRTGEQPNPAKAVTYRPMVKLARGDGELAPVPSPMPRGWRVTSVRYAQGDEPTWHLGLLTDTEAYVGIEQARTDAADLVEKSLGEPGERGDNTEIDGRTWRQWTAPKDDRALTTSIRSGGAETVLLVGGTGSFTDLRTAISALDLPQ